MEWPITHFNHVLTLQTLFTKAEKLIQIWRPPIFHFTAQFYQTSDQLVTA